MAEYLKLPEVAHRLNVSEKTARRYVKAGSLPSIFVGGAYRVSEQDLEEFLERARVEPGKVSAPSLHEPSFNDVLTEERRVKVLGAFHSHVDSVAASWNLWVEEKITNFPADGELRQGWIDQVAAWIDAVNPVATSLFEVFARDLLLDEPSDSADEIAELWKIHAALVRLNEVVDMISAKLEEARELGQADAEAQKRRNAFQVIEDRLRAAS